MYRRITNIYIIVYIYEFTQIHNILDISPQMNTLSVTFDFLCFKTRISSERVFSIVIHRQPYPMTSVVIFQTKSSKHIESNIEFARNKIN